MPTRRPLLAAALLSALMLLMLAGCNAARPTESPTPTAPPTATGAPTPAATPTPTPIVTPAPEPTPVPSPTATPASYGNQSPDPRVQRDVSGFGVFSSLPVAAAAAASGSHASPSVEELMQEGLGQAVASPTHIVIRGTASPASTRCSWRGVARNASFREAEIRFLFGLDEDTPIPSANDLFVQSMEYVNRMRPAFRDVWEENFRLLAYGGLSTEVLLMSCYVDYAVNEYILGSGPPKISISYDNLGESRSYDLYRKAHSGGRYLDEPLLTQAEYAAHNRQQLRKTEERLAAMLEGYEGVAFLAPLGSHAIAVEAWQAVAQWDVQLVDGALQAVRYGAGDHDAEYTQTLDNLKSRITTAAATDKFAGQRIASTEGLEAYYREIGAYDDITPGEGVDNPFTPAQPPPPHPTPSRP